LTKWISETILPKRTFETLGANFVKLIVYAIWQVCSYPVQPGISA